MKRIMMIFIIFGGIVPVTLLIVQQILLWVDPERVSHFRVLWYYVWPTAVFLMAAAGAGPAGQILILGVAILGNMVLYGIIGIIVGICLNVTPRGSPSGR
ncbi:MAG: hypothetical protein HYV94_04260 [Candidatus Rokubacteria bacterium]|nr:hypothetical protein [Candidatus Rokubacteria bacterium]